MRKFIFTILGVGLVSLCAEAQTIPDYYYSASSNGSNLSTFNSSSHLRSQFLYYPTDLNDTFRGGTITAIYIKPGGNQTNSTFDSLVVMLGTTTQTQLTSGAWVNYNFDTVLNAAQYVFPTVTSGAWLKIELTTPYYWDGNSNLVLDVSQKGYQRGFSQQWYNPGGSPAPRMKYGGMTTPTYLNNFPPIFMGFDVCTVPDVNLGNDTLLCDGGTLQLNAGSGSTYIWSDSSTNQTLNVNTAGTYHVTVNNEGCTASDTIIVTTGATASGTQINNYNVGNGTHNFTVANAVNVDTYEWNFGDGNTSTQVSPNHTYTASGTYTVTVKLSSECGDTTLTTTIQENLNTQQLHNKQSIKIYPNPTKGVLHIQTDLEIENLALYTLMGQRLNIHPIGSNQLDIHHLAAGVYILEVTQNEGKFYHKVELVK